MKYKKTILTAGKLVITILVIGWIIHSYGWDRIINTLSGTKLHWLGVGLFLFIMSVFLGACQWSILLNHKKTVLPFFNTLRLYFIGVFFNNFIFGTITGDAMKVANLHFKTKNGKTGFAATFLDRLAGLIALSFFAIIGGSIILFRNIHFNRQLLAAFSALAFFIVVFMSAFILIISFQLQNFVRSILNKLPDFKLKLKGLNILEALYLDIRKPEDRKVLVSVGAISLCVQCMRIVVHILCAHSLGLYHLSSTYYFFVIIPIVALIMIIPLPFGIREAVGGALFGLAGFVPDQAVIMEFLATIVGITGSLVGGVLFIGRDQAMDRKMNSTFEPGTLEVE